MTKRRVVGAVGLAILAVLLVVLILAHTPPVQRYVLHKVEQLLAEQGIVLDAKSLDYNLLKLSVTLQDITVRKAGTSELPQFAHIDRFHVNLAWTDLIGGVIHIENLVLEKPDIQYVITPAGNNLPLPKEKQPAPQEDSGGLPAFYIDYARITAGTLLFEDRTQDLSLSLPQWQAQITGQAQRGEHHAELHLVESGTLSLQGRTLPIRNLDLVADGGAESLHIQTLQLALADSTVSVSGTVADLSNPVLDLSAKAQLALKPLADFGGLGDPPVAGAVGIQGTATGPPDSLNVQFNAGGDQVRYGGLQSMNLIVKGEYLAERNQVQISAFTLNAPVGNIRAKAQIALAGSVASSLQAQVERLNLQRLTEAFDLDLRLASRATGSVNLTWPGMKYRVASGRALLNLDKLQPGATRNQLPVSGRVEVIARDGHITLNIGNPANTSQANDIVNELRAAVERGLKSFLAALNMRLRQLQASPAIAPYRAQPASETLASSPSIVGESLPRSLNEAARTLSLGGARLQPNRLPPQANEASTTTLSFGGARLQPRHMQPQEDGALAPEGQNANSSPHRWLVPQPYLRRIALPADSRYPAILGARLNASPRLLRALFALPQAEAPAQQPPGVIDFLATQLQGQISISPQGALSGNLRANITDLSKFLEELAGFQGKPGSLLPVSLRGSTSITAQLGGSLDRPVADITMSATSMAVAELQNVSLQVNARYTPADVLIRQATIAINQQEQMSVAGTVGLRGASPSLNLTVDVNTLSVSTVLAGLDRASIPASGQLSMHATVSGTVERPVAQATVSASDLQAYNEPWGSLSLNAELRNNLLQVDQFQLEKNPLLPGQSLTAELTYNLESEAYTLEAQASGLNIEQMQLPDGRSLQAAISFQAQGKGTLEDPGLQATLNITGLTANQQKFGDLSASLQVANQTANVNLQAPQWGTSLTAQAGIEAPYPGEFHLQTQNLEVNSLPVELPQALREGNFAGSVSLDVQGQGPLGEPQQLDLTARIPQLNLTYRGQNISVPQPVVARYANQVLNVEPSTFIAGTSRFQIGGRLPLEEGSSVPADLNITGAIDLASVVEFLPPPETPPEAPSQSEEPSVQLSAGETPSGSPAPVSTPVTNEEQLAAQAAEEAPPQKLTATGQLQLDLNLQGTLRNIVPRGSLNLQGASFAGPPLPAPVQDLTLRATIQNGVADLQQLSAQFAGGKIQASGNLPLALLPESLPVAAPVANAPATFNASVTGLKVGEIEGVGDNVTGTLSLALEARAPQLSLAAIDAQLFVEELNLDIDGIPIGQRGNSLIVVRGGLARMEQVIITGPETQLVVAGTAGLVAPRDLDIIVRGQVNAALATVFAQDLRIQGITSVEVSAGGTAAEPQMQGFFSMQGGQVSVEKPQVALTDLGFRVDLTGREVRIAQFSGALNGGRLTASGGFLIGSEGIQQPDLRIAAENVYMNFPEGLRSISNFSLNLTEQEKFYILGGEIHLLEGFFRERLLLPQLLSYVRSSPSVELTGERSPFLERLHFNIDVDTRSPIVIDNNIARAAVDADLRLVGEYYIPSIVGRVTFQEAGELYFSGKTFYIDRGVITFLNEQRIEPSLDILTHTQTAGYDINMLVQGRGDDIQTSFTSDPPLPEPDVISVLVFGKPLSEVRGGVANIAAQQGFSLVAGTLGGSLSQGLQQATGLSQVSIEPTLIAEEATPTARLTIGQQLAQGLRLVYSVNLSDAGDQIWLGEYKFTPRLLTRVTKQQDNSYRFDLRDQLRFGNAPDRVERNLVPTRKVESVTFSGNTVFTSEKLADRFGVRAGDKYDFFKVRKGMDKIESLYPDQQRLEAKVRLNVNQKDSTVAINIAVEPGPVVLFSFEGWDVPGGVRKRVREIWIQGVFDQQRATDSVEAIRGALVDRGYLQNQVEYSINMQGDDEKRVIFDINPGTHFSDVMTVFPGAKAISPDTLAQVLEDGELKDKLLTEPSDVRNLLRGYYEQHGYLRAEVQPPRPVVDPEQQIGRILIPINEGPLFRVGDIRFQDAQVFSEERLRAVVSFQPGQPYDPTLRDRSIIDLQRLYNDNGYLEASIEFSLDLNARKDAVIPVFRIQEGEQSIVRQVNIIGNDEVTKGLIGSQLLMRPGEVLQGAELANSRANLYSTGAFQLVEIEHRSVDPTPDLKPNQKLVDVDVRVLEVQPFQWTYGGYFDTDRGPGGISDFSSRNITGNAQTLGLRLRYDRNRQESRVYFSQPLLRRFPVKTTASTYYIRNSRFGDNDQLSLIDDQTGLSLEQESRWRADYLLTWAYRLERVRIFNRGVEDPDQLQPPINGEGALPGEADVILPPIGGSLSRRVAPLVFTLTRETRNDVLNASRGLFISQSLSTSFRFLGSQQQFVKYYGQYYQYIPLGRPLQVPFSEAKQPRLIYAGALRIGLAGGLGGQGLIQSERFFAGGGTTVRGFAQDQVGPQQDNVPIGGNAIFLLNNELRFPLKWIFDGVGFVDVGNVYREVGDFNPLSVRKSAGFGLRIYTPYIMIRADLGFKLDPRNGERVWQPYVSIGQAF